MVGSLIVMVKIQTVRITWFMYSDMLSHSVFKGYMKSPLLEGKGLLCFTQNEAEPWSKAGTGLEY